MSGDLEVEVGQVWKDNDPRGGPMVLVVGVCHEPDPEVCSHLRRKSQWPTCSKPHAHVVNATLGSRPRLILLSRFGGVSTRGYRLISRVEIDVE